MMIPKLSSQTRKKPSVISSLVALLIICLVPFAMAGDNTPGMGEGENNSTGSPVGPTKKIVICHNGRTLRVDEHAVPAHLGHGDTLGPCAEDVVICDKGSQTKVVSATDLPGYLAHGATLGACPNKIFMCNNLNHTIVVDADRVNDHLSRGHKIGLCDGFKLICLNGKTIRVTDKAAEHYLAKGAYLGYCLGSQGPVISTNDIPPQASQPERR